MTEATCKTLRYEWHESVDRDWSVVPCGNAKVPVLPYKNHRYTLNGLVKDYPGLKWHSLALRLGPEHGGFVAIDCDGASAVELWNLIYPAFNSNADQAYVVYNRPNRFQVFYYLTPEQWEMLAGATGGKYSSYYHIRHYKVERNGELETYNTLPGEQLEIRLSCLSMLPGSHNTQHGTFYRHRGSLRPTNDETVFWFIFNYVVGKYNEDQTDCEENRHNSNPIDSATKHRVASLALEWIDPNALDWDEWSKTLMSAHNCGMTRTEVLAWSRKSAKHTDSGFDQVWNYLKNDKNKMLGLRSLIKRANKFGYNGFNSVFLAPKEAIETEPEDVQNYGFIQELHDYKRVFIKDKSEQHRVYDELIAEGYKHIINMCGTGYGKTTEISRYYPANGMGINYIARDKYDAVNISPDFQSWSVVVSRHGGLVREMGTDGTVKIRRKEDTTGNNQFYEPSNCMRYGIWKASLEKGIEIPSEATKNNLQRSVLCSGCPAFMQCTGKQRKEHGIGSGFLANRRYALSQARVISHYLSLPAKDTYDYQNRIGVIDEFGLYSPIHTRHYKAEEIMRALLFYHDMLPPLLFNIIKGMIDALEAVSTTKHGYTNDFWVEWLGSQNTAGIVEVLEAIEINSYTQRYEDHLTELVQLDQEEHFRASAFVNPIPEILMFLQDNFTYCEETVDLGIAPNGYLIVNRVDYKFLDTLKNFAVLISLDATIDLDEYRALMGVKPSEIAVIYSEQPRLDNVEFVYLYGLGNLGKDRSEEKKKQVEKLKQTFLQNNPKTGFIDFGCHLPRNSADYVSTNWMGGSRGSNAFSEIENLVLIGAPIANLNQMISRYRLIYGDVIDKTTKLVTYKINAKNTDSEYNYVVQRMEFSDFALRRYIRLKVCSEIQQAVGRLRAQHRTSERLKVFFVSDYPPPSIYEVDCLHVSDISPDSTDSRENAICRVFKAISLLSPASCTYSTIARLSKTTSQLVSWIFDQMRQGYFGFVPLWCEHLFNDCRDKLYQLLVNPVFKTKRTKTPNPVILNNIIAPILGTDHALMDKNKKIIYNCYNHHQSVISDDERIEIDEDLLDLDTTCTINSNYVFEKNHIEYDKSSVYALDIETSGLHGDDGDRLYMIGVKNAENTIIFTDKDEKTMLIDFTAWLRKTKPYALSGYNIQEFDIPFLKARYEHHGLRSPFVYLRDTRLPNVMTVGKIHWFAEYICSIDSHRVELFDLYHFVRMNEQTLRNVRSDVTKRLTAFDLKTVTLELGLRKEERLVLSHKAIRDAWATDQLALITEYLSYDLEDTIMLTDRILPIVYYQREYLDVSLQRLLYMGAATKWAIMMKNSYGGYDPVADDTMKYSGGLVLTKGGLYANCAKVDVTSLYPSIMLNYGITSRKDNQNHLLVLLRQLRDERLYYKGLAKTDPDMDMRQNALKILINSGYGMLSTAGMGFNDFTAAALVTAYGRAIAKRMIKVAEENGATVFQVDTDGIMFSSDSQEQNEKIYDKIRESLPSGIELKLEMLVDAVYIPTDEMGNPTKKSYLVFDKQKCKDSCGLYIKRNRSRLERTFDIECILAYLYQGGHEAMERLYKQKRADIISNIYPVSELAITRKITRGDKHLLNFGEVGDTITYYMVGKAYNVKGQYNGYYYAEKLDEMWNKLNQGIYGSSVLGYRTVGQTELALDLT